MVKDVSCFRSSEKYQKNYIRDRLMEYVGATGGKPVILQGNIHRGNEGFCGRGYLSNIKFCFPGVRQQETIMLTNHLMIGGFEEELVKFFQKNTENPKRSVAYILAYPECYLSGDIKRCGVRLAYDCMEKPFRLGKKEKKAFLREAGRFAYFPPVEKYLRQQKEEDGESDAPSS